MGRYLIAIFLVCLLWFPTAPFSAQAEKPATVTRLIGTFAPLSGAWSEYAIFDKKTEARKVLRISIVGVENDSFWYEVVDKKGEHSKIIKMLINGDPDDPDNIQRCIMKSDAGSPHELTGDFKRKGSMMAGRIFEQHTGILSTAGAQLLNVSTSKGVATVPAGTFDVSLHRIVDKTGKVYAEYNSSEKVRPFGVVNLETENTAILLVGHGMGATSLIKEEPLKMTPPAGLQERMPPGMVPGPASNLRQIPGMGTGYEPKQ